MKRVAARPPQPDKKQAGASREITAVLEMLESSGRRKPVQEERTDGGRVLVVLFVNSSSLVEV